MWPEPTTLSELNTVPASSPFVELLFAFSLLFLFLLLFFPLISFIYFYLPFRSFSSTVIERIAGIHSNMFARVLCQCVRVCDLCE